MQHPDGCDQPDRHRGHVGQCGADHLGPLRAAQAGQRIGGGEQGPWCPGPQRLQPVLDESVLQATNEAAQQPADQAVEDDRAEHDRRHLERPGQQQLTHAGNNAARVGE
jgi:hypothetical protein